MPFQPTDKYGNKDPNIYTGGRTPSDRLSKPRKKTNREIGHDNLLKLFRKVKPLTTQAINTASKLMGAEESSEATKLKAAMFLVEQYKLLNEKVYEDYDPEEEGDENEAESAPVLRLRVVDSERDNGVE